MSEAAPLVAVGAVVVVVAVLVTAYPAADRRHQEELADALRARGYRHIETTAAQAFGGCMNGKGGTRWRHRWTATDATGRAASGSACIGGGFMKPSIKRD